MKTLPGIILILITLISGCAGTPTQPASTAMADSCGELENAVRLRLTLIEDELNANHPRAALAYLDALPESIQQKPKALYLRAESYRDIADYASARPLYKTLSKGCLSGAGYHGMGLVDAAQQQLDTALTHLQQARTLLPADPKVRNDYGYALLLDGQFDKAENEFKTVLELSNKHDKAAKNLVLTLLVEGNEHEAKRYAKAVTLSDSHWQQIRQHADILRSQIPLRTQRKKGVPQ